MISWKRMSWSGIEIHGLSRTAAGMDFIFLFAIAVVMAVSTFFLFKFSIRLCRENKKHEDKKTRMALIALNYCAMSFAWCLYFSVNAGLRVIWPELDMETIVAKVTIALAVSACSFLIIWLLDIVADSHDHGSDEQQGFAKVALALGFLIGVSWESAFAVAFHGIAHRFGGGVTFVNLVLAGVMCAVVIPAYWSWILPEVEARLEHLESLGKISRSLSKV